MSIILFLANINFSKKPQDYLNVFQNFYELTIIILSINTQEIKHALPIILVIGPYNIMVPGIN